MARKSTSANTNTNKNKENNIMADILSDAEFDALLATPTRGVAGQELRKFIDSGVKGIRISLTEGEFAGKKAASVKVGLTNALKKFAASSPDNQAVADQINVILKDDQVYLLNKAAA